MTDQFPSTIREHRNSAGRPRRRVEWCRMEANQEIFGQNLRAPGHPKVLLRLNCETRSFSPLFLLNELLDLRQGLSPGPTGFETTIDPPSERPANNTRISKAGTATRGLLLCRRSTLRLIPLTGSEASSATFLEPMSQRPTQEAYRSSRAFRRHRRMMACRSCGTVSHKVADRLGLVASYRGDRRGGRFHARNAGCPVSIS